MPVKRGQNYTSVDLNIVGSSTFGRYPKISIEKTYNMFQSDDFLVPYAGYKIALSSARLRNGATGRGIFTSSKLNKIITVIDENVFLIDIVFDQQTLTVTTSQVILIGQLQSNSGVVYIAENNKPQILISDNEQLYLYDPTLPSRFQVVNTIKFTPGFITFHDTYFICAARQDSFYSPPATNTWRLSGENDGLNWADDAQSIGLLQTKPDQIQAVVRFPSKGNMIFVMGQTVSEAWFNTGAQLFPYQRTNQFNIDYGCKSPASVAYMDEIVVWLASNEKSGPILMYSTGGMPQKITTDGIDYLFGQLQFPEDSQGFLFRQDGHLFYHINFYKDNLSLFVDFLPDGTHKIYHAADQNLNYFIAAEVAFFKNQYYFVSKNTGNMYIFDTVFTIYQDNNSIGIVQDHIIPRMRTCKNIRLATQDYFVANDVGFTIESGETDYEKQSTGPIRLITQDGKLIITQNQYVSMITQDGNGIITQDNKKIVFQQTFITNGTGTNIDILLQNGSILVNQAKTKKLVMQQQLPNPNYSYLIAQQNKYIYTTPRVDLSISTDGGATFGSDMPNVLPGIGKRKNKLQWWQLGLVNDLVIQVKFWSQGRIVVTNGVVSVRT